MDQDCIRQAAQRIADARHPSFRDMSSEALEAMKMHVKTAQERIARRIMQAGQQFDRARGQGDWEAAQEARDNVLLLQDDLQDLGEETSRIEDAYQQRLLYERLVDRLGSPFRLQVLEGTILVLIIAVLAILWVEMAYELTPEQSDLLVAADTAICGLFLGEFFWRMRYAGSNGWYWRRYWLDFLASLPLAGVLRVGRLARIFRAARAARIARLARAARVLRAVRGLAFMSRGFDKIAAMIRLPVFSRPLALTLALLVFGALTVSWIEGGTAPAIDGFWQSMWWSFTTVVTGGFADLYNPESALGRGITVVLVILGIILTGALTAGLASVLLGDDTRRIERRQEILQRKLDDVCDRLDAIEQTLDNADATDGAPDPN